MKRFVSIAVAFSIAISIQFASSPSAAQNNISANIFTSPEQLLVDLEAVDLVAIVKVKRAETRWAIISHGDHIPLIAADCEMEKILYGDQSWPAGTVQTVTQNDYSPMLSGPISAPVIEGQRYLLFAFSTKNDRFAKVKRSWHSHQRGFFLVRGQSDKPFVLREGKRYAISAIHNALGRRLPLDQIVEPAIRLSVARKRLERGDTSDTESFIDGLKKNVLDTDGQMKNISRISLPKVNTFTRGLLLLNIIGQEGQSNNVSDIAQYEDMAYKKQFADYSFTLWYDSLAVLRDLGKDKMKREQVVAALTLVATTARQKVRLAAALALVDLGSDAGREALVKGFESESGPLFKDPPANVFLFGRYPHDDSSVAACSHALARLGDYRGIKHRQIDVRLAAAEGITDNPGAETQKMLESLAAELDQQVEKLRVSGKIDKPRTRGDFTYRYPDHWARTHRLLARFGSDDSLRRLVDAFMEDAKTYPKDEKKSLMPTGQLAQWSVRRLSPAAAIRSISDNHVIVLTRLQKIYASTEKWNDVRFKTLRELLEKPEVKVMEDQTQFYSASMETELARRLNDSDPYLRATALAAAGYYQMDMFFEKVLEAAIKGEHVERRTAVYALGFYNRDLPEETLRQLMASSDIDFRYKVLELATRNNPARFAQEVIDWTRLRIENAKESKKYLVWESEADLLSIVDLLSRFSRGPMPQLMLDGLKDPDPAIRWIILVALKMGANPDVVPYIKPLAKDSNLAVREEVLEILRYHGYSDM